MSKLLFLFQFLILILITSTANADNRLEICNSYVEMINNNGFNFKKYSSSNVKFLPTYDGKNCGSLPGTGHQLLIKGNPVRAFIRDVNGFSNGWCVHINGDKFRTSSTKPC